jgi:hypothetical protein
MKIEPAAAANKPDRDQGIEHMKKNLRFGTNTKQDAN